jgi:peptidyl-prolyl cis-trans isomerase B (cyclophilin B)
VTVSARHTVGLVLAGVLMLSGCSRSAAPNPPGPASVECDWQVTLQSFPGMDAAITPPVTVPAGGHQTMTITTNRGTIIVDLDLARAPCTAASVGFLIHKHYYDQAQCPLLNTIKHTLQCGPERSAGYVYRDENLPPANPTYQAGDVAIFEQSPNTSGGELLFVYARTSLGSRYPLCGHVLSGLDVLAAVGAAGDGGASGNAALGGHPQASLTFESVTVGPVH